MAAGCTVIRVASAVPGTTEKMHPLGSAVVELYGPLHAVPSGSRVISMLAVTTHKKSP